MKRNFLTYAFGTSPIAATPAGNDKTPAPTHPLIKLNAAVAIVCFGASSAPDAVDFTRMRPLDAPPPRRGRVNTPGLGTSTLLGGAAEMVVGGANAKDEAVAPMVLMITMTMLQEDDGWSFMADNV